LSCADVCQLSSKSEFRLISRVEPSYNNVGSASSLPSEDATVKSSFSAVLLILSCESLSE